MKFHATWSVDKRTFTFADFWLISNDSIKEIRKNIWNVLLHLKKEDFQGSIKEVIKNYVNNIRYDNLKELLEFDFAFTEKLIEKYFNNKILADCDFIRDYTRLLRNAGISPAIYSELEKSFTSDIFELKDLFTRSDRKELEMEFEEYEDYRKKRIQEYVKDFQVNDFINLYDKLSTIIKVEQNEVFQIRQDFNHAIDYFADKNFGQCVEFLKYVVREGNSFGLPPHFILNKILNHALCDPNSIWDLINKNKFLLQNDYAEIYFGTIPDKYVNQDLSEKLIEFYQITHFEYLNLRLDNFSKYERIQENIYLIIIKILWNKAKNGENIIFNLIFNPYTESFKKLEEIFKDDIQLLKKLYFYEQKRDIYSDHNGSVFKLILSKNNDFIIEFLENRYKGKRFLTRHDNNQDLRILWTLDNYEEILSKAIEYHIQNNLMIFNHFLYSFFMIPPKDEKITKRRENFLITEIKKYSNNIEGLNLIFEIIVDIIQNSRTTFISEFISVNQDSETFKSLILESSGYSGEGGSFVPAMKERKRFWQSLIPLFEGINLLKHKRYVEENIDYYDKRIKEEKIRDFTDDFLH